MDSSALGMSGRSSICQRQTRLGRSLRIPKHRDGCSTVNRVRSSRPSLTTRVRLGRFRRIHVEMDVMSRQSRRLDFTVVLRHQVPPSQMLQRRLTSLATSIFFDKTCSFRDGDWCRPNRKSGHRWRGHRVYPRRSCKSNGSDDGTLEQALPRTVVRRFIPGSR